MREAKNAVDYWAGTDHDNDMRERSLYISDKLLDFVFEEHLASDFDGNMHMCSVMFHYTTYPNLSTT
jgi:hypothetical protein